ncbi:MAG: ABC transporter ATP-binding protein [Gemmatimonadaceae bacterium]|nr:ABC transporter ATP-binding protein [Gemmatimonadaceae bacterium]
MSAVRTLARLLPYYRPYRRKVAWGVTLVVLSSAVASAVPWFLRQAIDALEAGGSTRRVVILALAMVGVGAVAGLLRWAMREVMNTMSRHIEYDLRADVFRALVGLDAGFYGRMRTGEIMARATNDIGAVRQAAGPAVMYLTNTIFGGIFALLFMTRISGRLTLIALLPMVALPFVMAWLGRLIHQRFEQVQAHFGELTTLAQENLAGVRVVRAYRQEAAEERRFDAGSAEYLRLNLRLAALYGIMHPVTGLLAGLGALAVLGLGGIMTMRGEITVGAYIAFGFYLGMLTWPLIALGWVTNLFQRGAASLGRLLEIIDAPPAITPPAVPRTLPPAGAGRSLEFRNVGFHYPVAAEHAGTGPRWVLRGVSATVPVGGTLAIVGATGSGKSALIDLVPRLHDPQEGEVLLDGVPVRDLPPEELRAEIGYVPQESFLFGESILANLTYGGASDEAAREAAQVAQLDETVRDFPGGYDTMLGERGINLSGGQKQRAALARALARRPRVVLLDDALSAVDTHTEAEILRGLRETLAGRTAVIASHRVSAVRDADWIIVLEEGRVVEQGRHPELLAAGGRYWSLLARQRLEEAIETAP